MCPTQPRVGWGLEGGHFRGVRRVRDYYFPTEGLQSATGSRTPRRTTGLDPRVSYQNILFQSKSLSDPDPDGREDKSGRGCPRPPRTRKGPGWRSREGQGWGTRHLRRSSGLARRPTVHPTLETVLVQDGEFRHTGKDMALCNKELD